MFALLTLFLVMAVSLLVTRIATVALMQTGLSKEAARFQARSAFSGVGYTTSEAESVVNHPVRRRIVLFLMLLGNAGIVTAASSLILSFVSLEKTGSILIRIALLSAGTLLIFLVARSWIVDRYLSRLINRALKKYTTLDVHDYASLLHLSSDFGVHELRVKEGDWVCGKSLGELKLREEGIVVLGVERHNGRFLGVPHGDTLVHPDDVLILYGRNELLLQLERRKRGPAGDQEHMESVRQARNLRESEDVQDQHDEGRKASA